MAYEIRIRGHLGQQWQGWFLGLTILLEENGNTVLTGEVVDQAALHGILKKVRDLGMPLLSVNFAGTDSEEAPKAPPMLGPTLDSPGDEAPTTGGL